MYKVLKIEDCVATNFIDLLNLDTGTQDTGFDDSELKGIVGFEFMEEGGIYDCKMKLFGDFVDKNTASAVEVTIVEADVAIGKKMFFKVLVGSDVYYILASKAKDREVKEKMYFRYFRKDLIQVDDVIHANCL